MAGFRKAKGEQAMLKMGFYGPPGSGKTFTALLCAEGLAAAAGKRVAYIDTERGTDFYCQAVPSRKVHPEAFDFDAMYTKSITDSLKEARALKTSEYGVLVVDSVTHLWEAARNAYNGKTGADGQIPLWAWGKIKKPYRDFISHLLGADMHVIICGRQGVEFGEDEDGEMKRVGVKMKAEGETAYEPHILIRMQTEKKPDGTGIIQAFAEKDRTGILQGRTISNPNFDLLCKPLLPLLSGKCQAKVASDDEVAAHDGEVLAQQEKDRARKSDQLYQQFDAKMRLAKTKDELKKVGDELTAEVKKEMLASHVTALREKYQDCERDLASNTA